MRKDKWETIRDYIVKNSKFLFPVAVIVVVALTVSIALNAGKARKDPGAEKSEAEDTSVQPMSLSDGEPEVQAEETPKEVPLVANEDEGINGLITAYYETMASGDSASMAALYDELTEKDRILCEERAQYIDHVSGLEIYTKQGPGEGATLVYVYYRSCFVDHAEEVPGWNTFFVCKDGEGNLYIKNDKNLTEEEKAYGELVSTQDDTVEFNNRVAAEYNELMEANPQLSAYITELKTQLNASVGVRLAELNGPEDSSAPEGEGGSGEGEGQPAQPENPDAGEAPAVSGPQYATATTTVNVRDSDSEQADKLGKVAGGTKVQVQEVRANGWTKIVYENGDGFIKSEYLQMEESAAGQEAVGTVTANTSVKVRSAASTDASVLGVLPGGESLELLANEGEWCKVSYSGQVGYVKAEFVTQ